MLSYFNVFAQELAGIFIFFYSIERFSKLILHEHLEKVKEFFTNVSDTNSKAMATGIIATVVLQSSTAVSTLAVTLTNAGVFGVQNALTIIFGAGIGTSSTALLVSLKWKSMEEVLIIIGAVLKFTKRKHLGKTIFYLGLLLFSIEQMSIATSALKNSPLFKYLFSNIHSISGLFFLGIILTIILQSSSLMTSILVILISQNGIDMRNAMIISIGAFVGTTLTALIVSLKMSDSAKKVGLLNGLISLIAGIINLIFVGIFINFALFFKDPGIGLAFGNTLSRIFSALISLGILTVWNFYSQNYKREIDKKI